MRSPLRSAVVPAYRPSRPLRSFHARIAPWIWPALPLIPAVIVMPLLSSWGWGLVLILGLVFLSGMAVYVTLRSEQ